MKFTVSLVSLWQRTLSLISLLYCSIVMFAARNSDQ